MFNGPVLLGILGGLISGLLFGQKPTVKRDLKPEVKPESNREPKPLRYSITDLVNHSNDEWVVSVEPAGYGLEFRPKEKFTIVIGFGEDEVSELSIYLSDDQDRRTIDLEHGEYIWVYDKNGVNLVEWSVDPPPPRILDKIMPTKKSRNSN